jgi:hypothetical protein
MIQDAGVSSSKSHDSTQSHMQLLQGDNVSFNPFDKNASLMDVDSITNNVIAGFSSTFPAAGRVMVADFKINNSKIAGSGPKGGILKQLISLIIGILEIPMRFGYLFKSLTYSAGAFGLGIGGLTKSFALGTKDLYLLCITIFKLILKYFLCIFSFTITTMYGGCFLIHIISFFFAMLHLFVVFIVDKLHDYIGVDLSEIVERAESYIKWPSPIRLLCYTCFGKPVKIRNVLTDVGVFEDIGSKISHDFNNVMPRYMKPSIPLGRVALKNLEKAIK